MNLREEIEAYHREHFDDTPEWTAKVILKMFEKRIDKVKEQNLCPDLMMYKGYNLACDWIKEMLK